MTFCRVVYCRGLPAEMLCADDADLLQFRHELVRGKQRRDDGWTYSWCKSFTQAMRQQLWISKGMRAGGACK